MKNFFISLTLITIFFNSGFAQENIRELQILHWNDMHSTNTPYEVKRKDRKTGEEKRYTVGGTSGVLGYINKFRNPNTLVLNAGDDYQGSPISTITRGFSQVHLLNLFNLDAFTIGNHEYDYSWQSLDSALKLANFDYLSANIFNENLNRLEGKAWIVKEVNGIKTGIIGLNSPELLQLTLPENMGGIRILDSDSVISVAIKQLKAENVNLIVLLTHAGVETDKLFAEKFYGDVDLIVGGHSHTPIFNAENINGTYIVQAGSRGRWIGKVNLEIDIDKDTIVSFSSELVETVYDQSINDSNAENIVKKMLADIEPQMQEVIGYLETDWKRSYTQESNLGQWQADAIRKRTGTDITFLNAGGIRKDLPAGEIKVVDIWEINPFGNNIVKFEVTGKTLKEMVENNLNISMNEIKNAGSSDKLVVSGVEILYNPDNFEADGDLLVSLKVNGDELSMERSYSISTNNYMAAQFRKYFGEVEQSINIINTGLIDRDVILDAVKEQKRINSVLEERIKTVSN
ncbi:MAG: 5'-nucleotidase C-terminal domain-containing protein [Ignavibacteriaceae bacterium]|nr:5'-nucleotidase C-terminal domain-containing protein [Ignavibacteriaceae bacterium]